MSRWHPHWCSPNACTAYADPDTVDRRYHRSRPIVMETEDPFVALYVHLGANPDGSEAYVGMSELEQPFLLPWFEEEPVSARSFLMPVERADELRHALASAVRVGRPRQPGSGPADEPVSREDAVAVPGTPGTAA